MKRQNMQDERILTQHRKVNSESYNILMFALIVSIIVQTYFLDAPFEQYAVEVICFFGVVVYNNIRHWILGVDLFGGRVQAKKTHIISCLAAAAAATVFMGVRNYIKLADIGGWDWGNYITSLLITFMVVICAALVMTLLLNYFNNKKQAKILKQLDEQED